jgi:hypothetical protein
MTDVFFVTCANGKRHSFLLGPFTSEKACKVFAEFKEDNPDRRLSEVQTACCAIDSRAHFYAWGMCRIRDFVPGEIIGVLNEHNPEKWDKVLS